MCANFSVSHRNGAGCILATGDVSCRSLQPTPSCRADSPDAVPVGPDIQYDSFTFIYSFEAEAELLSATGVISVNSKCEVV